MYNHYNPNLKNYASELRKVSVSKAEKKLWKDILSRNRIGVKFKRQRPIDRFIVDFFSAEVGLIIEVDGNSHLTNGRYDKYREVRLRSLGYEILRFTEGEVLNNIHEVATRIHYTIDCLKLPPP